jgi:hypothetical protein
MECRCVREKPSAAVTVSVARAGSVSAHQIGWERTAPFASALTIAIAVELVKAVCACVVLRITVDLCNPVNMLNARRIVQDPPTEAAKR